jgi:hypothetical protein
MKQSELQRAAQLGQQILQQQAELEARVRELSEVEARSARAGGSRHGGAVDSDGEELGEETRGKLMELKVAVENWKQENEIVWDGIKGSSSSTNSRLPTLTSTDSVPERATQSEFLPHHHPHQQQQQQLDPPSSSASQNRRTRNNAPHRSNDIEFATEIGQALLVEVRRLQTLLSERYKAIEELRADVDSREGREVALKEVVKVLEGNDGEQQSIHLSAFSLSLENGI